MTPAPEWSPLELTIERFEQAWSRQEVPSIDDYVSLPAGTLDLQLLRELVQIDSEYRFKRGESPLSEGYFARFPELEKDEDAAVAVICAEITLRRRLGAAAEPAEYLQRFPQLGPHLQTRLPASAEMDVARRVDTKRTEKPSLPAPHVLQVPGYEILSELGRGGMGIVYQARHTHLQRWVALKLIRDNVLGDSSHVQRFAVEAKAIARLNHPNIISIHEVGDCGGRPYLSMEFADQGSLDRRIAAGPVDLHEAARLVMEVAEAVHHAHQHGILHRDLKPKNIVLATRDEDTGRNQTGLAGVQPKITDFGLAKLLDEDLGVSDTCQILGTPSYMAPEQVSPRRPLGATTDVYGLGAVLYEALTGKPPVSGIDFLDTIQRVKNSEPIAPRKLRPEIPQDLEAICLKCLEKEPQHRYLSARLLAEDLGRFLAGETVLSRPVGRTARAWRWCRRNPTTSLLLVAVFIALVGGIGATSFLALETRRELDRTKVSLVTAQLLRADSEFNTDPWESRQLLYDTQAIPPEDRDFAWRLLAHRCRAVARPLAIDAGQVKHFAVSADGRLLATATHGPGGTVIVWDQQAQQFKERARIAATATMTLAFSPDAHVLAIADGYNVLLWDRTTGNTRAVLRGHTNGIPSLAFSSDGATLATASWDDSVRLWDVANGKAIATQKNETYGVWAVAFSPDGRFLATGHRNWTIKLRDPKEGEVLKELGKHGNTVHGLAFSPDSTTLASCSRDQSIVFWDMKSYQREWVVSGHGSSVNSVRFSPEGALASAGDDGAVRIWDPSKRSLRLTLRGDVAATNDVGFMAEGRTVITLGKDGRLREWPASGEARPTKVIARGGPITSVAVRADGSRLALGSGNHAEVWDVQGTPEIVDLLGGDSPEVNGVAFSPNGRLLVSAGGWGENLMWCGVEIWQAETLKHQGSVLKRDDAEFSGVAFSGDGTRLAIGGGVWDREKSNSAPQGTIWLYDTRSQRIDTIAPAHLKNVVVSIAISPDGRTLASVAKADRGESDPPASEVKIWNAETRREVRSLTTDGHAEAVSFSPDGQSLVVAAGAAVQVYELATGRLTQTLRVHAGPLTSLAFSPDHQTLAAGSAVGKAYLWNYASGQLRATIGGHSGRISCMAFSPAGDILVTASSDGVALLHHAPPVE